MLELLPHGLVLRVVQPLLYRLQLLVMQESLLVDLGSDGLYLLALALDLLGQPLALHLRLGDRPLLVDYLLLHLFHTGAHL